MKRPRPGIKRTILTGLAAAALTVPAYPLAIGPNIVTFFNLPLELFVSAALASVLLFRITKPITYLVLAVPITALVHSAFVACFVQTESNWFFRVGYVSAYHVLGLIYFWPCTFLDLALLYFLIRRTENQ